MNFKAFKVTKKKNVKTFDTETGVFELLDDASVGLAIAEHLLPAKIPMQKQDPITGESVEFIQEGYSHVISVLWSHLRSPAIRHEAATDLVWLEVEKEEDSRIEEEPYTSVEHIKELAEEGDFESQELLKGLVAFSNAKLANEVDDEEIEIDEDEAPEMTM